MITYRVLHVEDNNVDTLPSIVTTGSPAYTNPTIPQVLTSNVNGQLYVIGTPNEVFANQTGARAIAPRSSLVESNNSVVTTIRRVCCTVSVELSKLRYFVKHLLIIPLVKL